MSIISKLRRSRSAAKDHKQHAASQRSGTKEEPAEQPYRHIPTHAASDALSGAPSSWKQDDRLKIREHHKRRSQMANLSEPSIPESSRASTLGSRNSSHDFYTSAWTDHSRDASLAPEPALKTPRNRKSRHLSDSSYSSGIGPSPLGSYVHSEDPSPTVSSGVSTASQASTSSTSSHIDVLESPSAPITQPSSTTSPSRRSRASDAPDTRASTMHKLAKKKPVLNELPAIVLQAPSTAATSFRETRNRWSWLASKQASSNEV